LNQVLPLRTCNEASDIGCQSYEVSFTMAEYEKAQKDITL